MGPVEKLKSEIGKRGLANPNRFQAYISIPGFVIDKIRDFDMRSLNVLCESVNFPGKQIESLDYSMYRNNLKIPSGYINDEVSMTFRLTEDFFVKRVFDVWQAGIVRPKNYKARYYNDYVKDIVVAHEDKNDKEQYSIKIINAYPITVGAIEKSNESTDSALRLTVTFACRDVEDLKIKNTFNAFDGINPNIFNIA